MQKVYGRNTSRELPIEVDIVGVKHILGKPHGSDRQRTFVDRVEHRVGVAVDNARHYIFACAIDDPSGCSGCQVLADTCDLASANKHICVSEHAASNGEHCSVADQRLRGILICWYLSVYNAQRQGTDNCKNEKSGDESVH